MKADLKEIIEKLQNLGYEFEHATFEDGYQYYCFSKSYDFDVEEEKRVSIVNDTYPYEYSGWNVIIGRFTTPGFVYDFGKAIILSFEELVLFGKFVEALKEVETNESNTRGVSVVEMHSGSYSS